MCATTPITPTVSNLKCVTSVSAESSLLGGNPEYVLLGTGRRAVEVFGPTSNTMCAKLDNSSVKCWGNNQFGKLGVGDTPPERGQTPATMGDNLPVLNLGSDSTIVKVVTGFVHSCAVLSNGKMKCWGSNSFGQLGRDPSLLNEIGSQTPVFRPDEEVVDAAAGGWVTCAIFKNTSLACWGRNAHGMLGQGSSIGYSWEPLLVDLGVGHHAIQVAVGNSHVCALLNTFKVKCWGRGQFGQLGNGDSRDIGLNAGDMGDNLPILPLENVKHIATGFDHSCAILHNNGVTCWGYNAYEQAQAWSAASSGDPFSIGDEAGEVNSANLITLNDGSGQSVNATELALGTLFSCARLRNQSVYCWGYLPYIQDYETLN